MKNTKKLHYLCLINLFSASLLGCSQSSNAIKEILRDETISISYKDVVLNWENNSFEHEGNVIFIPEKWGVAQKREAFKNMDSHDIKFQYHIKCALTYGGETIVETKFKDLDEIRPDTKSKTFEISVVGLGIDSKLIVKDELINDYYFKYDTNTQFYNVCYFKIAKNDVNQLKDGYFNQINVKLNYYEHYDKALSFKTHTDDGLNEVGYYSEVTILRNPNLE